MKNLVFVSFIMMLSIKGMAQVDTIEWAPKGATWLYRTFCQSCRIDAKLVYEKDTIIDGDSVKKMNLYARNYVCGPDPNGSGNWIFSIITDNLYRSDYLFNRNEYVFWYQDGQFKLLFCFKTDIGDSWKVPHGYTLLAPCDTLPLSDSVFVTAIDTQINSGKKFISYKTSSKNNIWGIDKLIKNIGSQQSPYPFPEYNSCINAHTPSFFITEGISCYYDTKRGYVNFSTSDLTQDCYGEITAIPPVLSDMSYFTVYPNPTSTVLNIQFSTPSEVHYQIFDILGEQYKEGTLFENKVDVSSLPTGCYLIRLFDNKTENRTIRFIKF